MPALRASQARLLWLDLIWPVIGSLQVSYVDDLAKVYDQVC